MARYINPFTDFGFKHLFGTESNKQNLISFLNAVLPDQTIAKLTYKNVERQGISEVERKVIFDLHCENEEGEKFIVELQRAKQEYFKDRTLYYSTFPITEQAIKGKDWSYELKPVYTVSILNFRFPNPTTNEDDTKVKRIIKLSDIETNEVFYDKLTLVYLQMPNFLKEEHELETLEDKWYYVFKHLDILEKMPARFKEKIFKHFFESAELANLPRPRQMEYEESLKQLRDLKNVLRTAEKDAAKKADAKARKEEQEIAEKKIEQARKEEQEKAKQQLEDEQEKAKQQTHQNIKEALKDGFTIKQVIKLFKVTEEEVLNIKNNQL